MQAYEFNVQTSDKGELMIPLEIQQVLKARRKARVIFLFDDDEAEWKRLTSEAFLAGYADKDAAYDNL
jgi:bifunctional DNA-binding transcriptional regulator/antitoxin component of YhaV-PrlF toxin-antitoxin module